MFPLFSPREQEWHEHFMLSGDEIIGLTELGRATVAALALNRPLIREIRAEEVARGWTP